MGITDGGYNGQCHDNVIVVYHQYGCAMVPWFTRMGSWGARPALQAGEQERAGGRGSASHAM